MSYIGQGLPADTFQGFTTDKFTGDGTANKAFTLTKEPFSEDTILVTIDGVVQEPTDDFTVSGTTLTLVGTAANGSEINVTHLSGPVQVTQAASLDLNGASDKLILDADGDTTISADTDDQIDFKTGGEDSFIMANGGVLTLLNGNTPTINLQDGTTTKGQLIIDSFDQFKITQAADDDIILSTNDTGRLTIKNDGKFATGGEGTPDVDAGGITLDHNANDSFIMTFKNSDVTHGITSVAEADTYGAIQKANSSNGGVALFGLAAAGTTALELQSYFETNNTSKATNANVPINLKARLRTGTSSTAPSNGGANANLFGVSDANSIRFIVDSEGDIHVDGSSSISTYDKYEDAHLVRAYDLSHGKGVIDSKFDKFISYNHEKLAEMKLVGREEDGTPNHFINMTGMQRLHNGAIWQQYEKHQRLAEAVYEMAKEALGEDKADAILEKHDIKLLN